MRAAFFQHLLIPFSMKAILRRVVARPEQINFANVKGSPRSELY
jgi:hypothetical protein